MVWLSRHISLFVFRFSSIDYVLAKIFPLKRSNSNLLIWVVQSQKPKWRIALQSILFKEGDIVAHGEEAEEQEQQG